MGTFSLPTTTDHSLGPYGPEGGEEIIWGVLKGAYREHCEGEFGGEAEGICCRVTAQVWMWFEMAARAPGSRWDVPVAGLVPPSPAGRSLSCSCFSEGVSPSTIKHLLSACPRPGTRFWTWGYGGEQHSLRSYSHGAHFGWGGESRLEPSGRVALPGVGEGASCVLVLGTVSQAAPLPRAGDQIWRVHADGVCDLA